MPTAARPRKAANRTLREDFAQIGKLPVDREAGVIKGVKILGWDSKRNRRYTREAAQDAVARGLYEGAQVFKDHAQPGQSHSVDDLLGILHNPEVRGDGLYADWHYYTTKPIAEQIVEDIEKGRGGMGMSHDATWDKRHFDEDGTEVIDRIDRVNSVDLVTRPATNRNLWEGDSPIKTRTLKQIIEAAKLKPAAKKSLLEMDGQMLAQDMPAEPAEEESDARALLAKAIGALVQSEDEADHQLAQKVMKLLKPESPDTSAEEAEDDKPPDKKDDGAKDDEEKPKDTKESLDGLRAELEVRDLIEEANLRFAKPAGRKAFIRSLVPLSEAERKALIEERKDTTPVPGKSGPRSQGQGGRHVQESMPATAEEQASLLLR